MITTMSKKVTLGGERLGSGAKTKVDVKTFERSTHDLGYLYRTTASAGTLIPFMSEVALPGDTFDIDLDVDVKTPPAIGPLFGSMKVQLDLYQIPIRLYNGKLQMNQLGIGLDMKAIKLPQMTVTGRVKGNEYKPIDIQQVNPSSLLAHLNITGVGQPTNANQASVQRDFNAIPLLAYWDIYKNYYANKQEGNGAAISKTLYAETPVNAVRMIPPAPFTAYLFPHETTYNPTGIIKGYRPDVDSRLQVNLDSPGTVSIYLVTDKGYKRPSELFENVLEIASTQLEYNTPKESFNVTGWVYRSEIDQLEPTVQTFPLKNIDTLREYIYSKSLQAGVVKIEAGFGTPISLVIGTDPVSGVPVQEYSQQGLALKTYQSDLFNNWMSTEWLDGANGINQITAVDVSDGKLQVDSLVLANKVYAMLNRIAISGGTYQDWLDATYDHTPKIGITSPVYEGGLIKELVFQEVISNAEAGQPTEEQPLGTLAGRGVLSNKHKGGKAVIKVDEPSYIMGIFSITPRLDYSQGNKWDMNLKTMDDFHKPDLDAIGFQDLITDQMAWWDTKVAEDGTVTYKSAGKQPAWINYMTNTNRTRGNFADEDKEMFMTLNRKYEYSGTGIKDLTTYIDPKKFTHVFAKTSRDAQNYWVQIAVDITARRKMSAKVMPNL